MPAVKYDYDYYTQKNKRNNQDVAKTARSKIAVSKMSAQKKVSSNKGNIATSKKQNLVNSSFDRRRQSNIDIPVTTKKKVVINKPEEMKLKKPKGKSKTKHKVEGAKRTIVATLIAFGMLFIICTRYTQINEKSHEVNSLEKSLASAKALNGQLTSEVESKTDLNYIEKYAKYQLGMQKPSDSQIVRIAYDKQDKISTPIVISEENESGFFGRLLNDLKKLID